MNYTRSKLRYIPKHCDRPHAEAITPCLNQRWQPKWGDLFFRTGHDLPYIRGYAQHFNTSVKNRGDLRYSVAPVSFHAEEIKFPIQLLPQSSERRATEGTAEAEISEKGSPALGNR